MKKETKLLLLLILILAIVIISGIIIVHCFYIADIAHIIVGIVVLIITTIICRKLDLKATKLLEHLK